MVPFQSFLCNFMSQHKVTIETKVFLHQLILSHFETRDPCFDLPSLDFSVSSPSLVIAWGKTSPTQDSSQSPGSLFFSKGSQYTHIFTATVTGIGRFPQVFYLLASHIWWRTWGPGDPMPWREKERHLPAVANGKLGGESPGSSGFAIYMYPFKHKKTCGIPFIPLF